MYIQRNTKRVGDKIYTSVVLREGYREGGKVKQRTLLNLSKWPKEKIADFENFLKGDFGKTTIKLGDVNLGQGSAFGALYVLKKLCDELGITKALGKDKKALLCLLMITNKIISPCSKLGIVSWSKTCAIAETLGISTFNEDSLYKTLDWLAESQDKIEDKLFSLRKASISSLFLYDVTSSYLEGEKNELACFGYNRDGKINKKQIVIGLLTDRKGYPVTIEVFEGNTADPKTVASQIAKLAKRFKVEKVILVGDKGMIKKTPIDVLQENGFNYITSITKEQIKKLCAGSVITPSLFDNDLVEVVDGRLRYVLRKNPVITEQTRSKREERFNKTIEEFKKINLSLKGSKRAKEDVALRKALTAIENRKLFRFIKNIEIKNRELVYTIDKEALKEEELFDGCYAIKTDVIDKNMSARTIYERYKDLKLVENAFRTMKTNLLEIRPLYHRKEERTRGHVFIAMLAYMVVHRLREATKDTGLTTKDTINQLHNIQVNEVSLGNERLLKVNGQSSEQKAVLNALGITLPKVITKKTT